MVGFQATWHDRVDSLVEISLSTSDHQIDDQECSSLEGQYLLIQPTDWAEILMGY